MGRQGEGRGVENFEKGGETSFMDDPKQKEWPSSIYDLITQKRYIEICVSNRVIIVLKIETSFMHGKPQNSTVDDDISFLSKFEEDDFLKKQQKPWKSLEIAYLVARCYI